MLPVETKTGIASILLSWLEPLSKLAQVVAVVIAGWWAWHLHETTSEAEEHVEVRVSTEVVNYHKTDQLLVVHIREKNVGKVPVHLKPDALLLTVKKIPESFAIGYIDTDTVVPVLFEVRDIFKRYGKEVWLDAGVEFQDVATFVVKPGLYHTEAKIILGEKEDWVNGIAVTRVEQTRRK